MVTPYDFVGASAVGSANATAQDNIVRRVLRYLYGAGHGGSAYTIDTLISKINEALVGADEEAQKELARVISIIGTNGVLKIGEVNKWAYTADDYSTPSAVVEQPVTKIKELFTGDSESLVSDESLQTKGFGVVLVNSPFLGPQVRDAEKAEIFLNAIPTFVMSRCTPFVEMTCGFQRPGNFSAMRTPSLLKFLLGAVDTKSMSDPNAAMHYANVSMTSSSLGESTTSQAGMEIFTSPQTLVNLDPVSESARYVPILDPFRPLATLVSLTITVVSAGAGLYSYKKATAIIKLHDRSRLSELSDLVRPQVYKQTTVKLAYGWRHPPEPGNPYADYINENLIKIEAYGVENSSFAFDPDGGVTITLALFTKGPHELHSLSINDGPGAAGTILAQIEQATEDIRKMRQDLRLDPPTGVGGEEIRSMQILNAGERGVLPDFEEKEIGKALQGLRTSLSKSKADVPASTKLLDSLGSLYGVDSLSGKKTRPSLFEQLKSTYAGVARSKFKIAETALDPFIPREKRYIDKHAALGWGDVSEPIMEAMRQFKEKPIKEKAKKTDKPQPETFGSSSAVVSFGNVFTTLIASTTLVTSGVDEIQAFFYQLNERAGYARCLNVAEFPVEMALLREAYAEELETTASDRMSLISFMSLLIRCSVDDMRSIAYGFRTFFLDDKQKLQKEVSEKKKQGFSDAMASVCGKMGSFQKPEVEVFCETLFETTSGDSIDVFESEGGSGRKIMRIHVFDRTVNPYRAATQILRTNVGGVDTFYSANDEYVKRVFANDFAQISKNVKGATLQQVRSMLQQSPSAKIIDSQIQKNVINQQSAAGTPIALTNEDIKHEVSRMLPTITYGTNASNVITAQLSSKQDPLLTAAQLTGLNKNKRNSMEPNGSGMGGLPLRIIPAALTMTTMGCPLFNFGQFFFIDFNTGTSADNVYGVTGLTHSLSSGKFDSQITWSFYDAYGKFEGAPSIIDYINTTTRELTGNDGATLEAGSNDKPHSSAWNAWMNQAYKFNTKQSTEKPQGPRPDW